jgi:hypothetical protein
LVEVPCCYKSFGELNLHVIKPAVSEVHALAPFGISVLPIKQGKKVVQIRVGWWAKDTAALQDASNEMNRSKVGRNARLAGTVERVHEPLPSVNRMIRNLPPLSLSPKTS